MIRLLSCALAGVVAATASAQVSNTIVQVNATSAQLDTAGFTRVGRDLERRSEPVLPRKAAVVEGREDADGAHGGCIVLG